MCGGHGVHSLVRQLSRESVSQHKPPSAEIQREIKLLYAKGEIDGGEFHRLLERADRGVIARGDLSRREQAARANAIDANPATNHEIATLEIQIAHLRKQAEDAEWNAGRVSPGGDQAHAYLETKQGALFRARTLEAQLSALTESAGEAS